MIELNTYLFYGLLDILIVLIVVIAVLTKRLKKYKPYYEANTSPNDYFKKYLALAIKFTRDYAQKISSDAENGDKQAIKRQKHMVARLNWLVLERDFISTTKPISSYWNDINFRISKLLTHWTEANLITELPNEKILTHSLRNTSNEGLDNDGLNSPLSGKIFQPDTENSKFRERIKYLEKQVLQISSYKTLFEGLQNTYDSLKESYKKIKEAVQELELDADNSKRLKHIIDEHESAESIMEDQVKTMKDKQAHLNTELLQLEAAFATLEKEHFNAGKNSEQELKEMTALKNEPREADHDSLSSSKEAVESLENSIRELRGAINLVDIETDIKLELDEKAQHLGVQTNEIITFYSVLELENQRMQQELDQFNDENEN